MVFAMLWPWSNNSLIPSNYADKFSLVIQFWNKGLWNTDGLAFAIQMMLMLLLGHVFALSPFVEKGIKIVPKRASKMPAIKVFPDPYLSAIIPAKGDIAPSTN